MSWQVGDLIYLEYRGKTVPAEVHMASRNGASLALLFEGNVDGHVGSMAVLRAQDDVYRSIMSHEPVTLTARRPGDLSAAVGKTIDFDGIDQDGAEKEADSAPE